MKPLCQLATGLALCVVFASPAWAQTSSQYSNRPPTRRPGRPRRRCSATLACGSCRPVRFYPKAAGRPALIASTGIARKPSRISRISAGLSHSAPLIDSKSSRTSMRSAASMPIAGRFAPAARRWTIRGCSRRGGPASATFGSARSSTSWPPIGNSRRRWRFARRSSCQPPSEDEGLGTGKTDFMVDAIVSGEAGVRSSCPATAALWSAAMPTTTN